MVISAVKHKHSDDFYFEIVSYVDHWILSPARQVGNFPIAKTDGLFTISNTSNDYKFLRQCGVFEILLARTNILGLIS